LRREKAGAVFNLEFTPAENALVSRMQSRHVGSMILSPALLRRCAPFLILCATALPVAADLPEYLARPDSSYAWTLVGKSDAINATLYELRLTSQTWHDIAWQHNLTIYVPTNPPPDVQTAARGSALLMIDGGSQESVEKKPSRDAILYGSTLAQKIGVPFAVLKQVPNQPLFTGLKEDALIAETFRRYIQTRDESWPLLFPMTKAAVRAMDAIGEFAKRELGAPIEKFVVTGASKRGWTTWLTAASDPRVVALAPMVIDMLNSRPQMDHQVKVFGTWSDQTKDYHELLKRKETEEVQRLWAITDPFTFREKLTQPKLIILGNNDPYWTTDALNLYWQDLRGPKWIHYVPNAGHNLVQTTGGQRIPPIAAMNALGVFTRKQLTGLPMPRLEWKQEENSGHPGVVVNSDPAPKSATVWVAHSSTHDFRAATWEQRPTKQNGSTITGEIDLPTSGSAAFYAALEFEFESVPFTLCTQIQIVDAQVAAGK
jgi:PhoPQ-activated pathogenicity-related protein